MATIGVTAFSMLTPALSSWSFYIDLKIPISVFNSHICAKATLSMLPDAPAFIVSVSFAPSLFFEAWFSTRPGHPWLWDVLQWSHSDQVSRDLRSCKLKTSWSLKGAHLAFHGQQYIGIDALALFLVEFSRVIKLLASLVTQHMSFNGTM